MLGVVQQRERASVLVVEDDPDDLLIATLRLERSGRFGQVLTARSVPEALTLLRGGALPSLILLDVNLGGATGFDLLDALGPAIASSRVLILSSSSAPKDLERASSHAAVSEYLVKPLTRAAVERIADRYG